MSRHLQCPCWLLLLAPRSELGALLRRSSLLPWLLLAWPGEPWASAATSLFPAAVTLGSASRRGLMANRNAIYVVPSRAKKKLNKKKITQNCNRRWGWVQRQGRPYRWLALPGFASAAESTGSLV